MTKNFRLTDFVRSGLLSTPKYPDSYPTNIGMSHVLLISAREIVVSELVCLVECEWTIVAPGETGFAWISTKSLSWSDLTITRNKKLLNITSSYRSC